MIEKTNKFALALVERILQNKLDYIREFQRVGNSEFEIESIQVLNKSPLEFYVDIWDAQGEESIKTDIMDYQELIRSLLNAVPENLCDIIGFVKEWKEGSSV